MIHKINITSGNYLFIEVPDDSYDCSFIIVNEPDDIPHSIASAFHGNGLTITEIQESENLDDIISYDTISTTKNITEEQAGSIVEKFKQKIGWRLDGDNSKLNSIVLFQNYKYEKPVPVTFLLSTAKESLQSLIQANGLDVSKNYLILLKK
jgi:hypothetical protein